jgi:hypothetical protein
LEFKFEALCIWRPCPAAPVAHAQGRAWREAGSLSENGVAVLPETFQVQCLDDPVGFLTTGADSDNDAGSDADAWGSKPTSPAAPIQASGGVGSPHMPSQQQIQWATPPTHDNDFSENAPLRYRSIPDLLETTKAMQDFEYSGLFLVAAEEPRSVAEALTEQIWKKAMEEEMRAIHENQTCVLVFYHPSKRPLASNGCLK